MIALPRLRRVAALVLAFAAAASPHAIAQSPLPAEPVSLDSLTAFRNPTANWRVAGGFAGDPRRDKTLTPAAGTGILINVPTPEARGHLLTSWDHGNIELELEYLVPPGSNSGIYLQGRYEVQILDSWGVREPKHGDAGAIYFRWDPSRGQGNEAFEGHAPRANAARSPGLWQKLQIAFEAPRFDKDGKKTRNARFVRVVHNGFTIHENVEVKGPTRAAAFNDEQPLGPLMIQGDHGAVAIRRLAVKRLDGELPQVSDLRYKLYATDYKRAGDSDNATPKSEGVPERFSHTAVEKSGKFTLVFTGNFTAPRDGEYAFAVDSSGFARLQIDGRNVVLPLERGSQPGTITLTKGEHAFRLDHIHTSGGRTFLDVTVAGPGFAATSLTRESGSGGGNFGGRGGRGSRQLAVEVKDRVLLQRGFVPYDPRKRLYAASIGTPSGANFAYDFETGALLRVWRGGFVDTLEMWENRGNDQVARPIGPSLTFNSRPVVALIEYARNGDWPVEPETLWTPRGYELEADGLPVFLASLSELNIRDRIAPLPEGKGFTRTLKFDGSLSSWSTWLLLAEAASITPQPDGKGWIVGDREWFLDWPTDAATQPVLRTLNGRQQLAVPLTRTSIEAPVTYSIVW